MLWLTRPPYLRWLVAAVAVALALYAELRPPPTAPHPFAVEEIPAGEEVTRARVELRPVPPGMLGDVELPAVAGRTIRPGEPVLPAALEGVAGSIPEGWWALELPVPEGASPGMELRVVVAPADLGGEAQAVPGVMVQSSSADVALEPSTLVAVPPAAGVEVAVAAREGRVTVLLAGG